MLTEDMQAIVKMRSTAAGFLLLAIGSDIARGATTFCYDCHDVMRPEDCNVISRCHGQACGMEVHIKAHGEYRYKLFCADEPVCGVHHGQPGPVGRREAVLAVLERREAGKSGRRRGGHHGDHGEHAVVCAECCKEGQICNAHLCSAYRNVVHTQPPTTTAPPGTNRPVGLTQAPITTVPSGTNRPVDLTQTPTTTVPPLAVTTSAPYTSVCRNHEEDGFSCKAFDMFHFCTDPSSLAYVLAHEKCRAHCGFCTPGVHSGETSAPVTAPPAGVCTDYDQDGFECASFDLFHFCTDPSSIAYVVAHEKCRKHCGFCTPADTTTAVQTTTAADLSTRQTTLQPVSTTIAPPVTSVSSTTTQRSTIYENINLNATKQDILTTQTGATADPVYTALPSTSGACMDVEEHGFSCAYMDQFDICTTTEPLLAGIRRDKCRRHCGLCTP